MCIEKGRRLAVGVGGCGGTARVALWCGEAEKDLVGDQTDLALCEDTLVLVPVWEAQTYTVMSNNEVLRK